MNDLCRGGVLVILESVFSNPIPVSDNNFVDFTKARNITFAIPWEDEFVKLCE